MSQDTFIIRPNGFGAVRSGQVIRIRTIPEPGYGFKIVAVLKDKSEMLWTRVVSEEMAREAIRYLTQQVKEVECA